MYALVDCNSFFCSCERLFHPSLHEKPVIVLSNNDGCAIARTQEAKDLGIKMGDPFFKIKALCQKHNVHVFSSNFSLYTNISDRVMSVLEELCYEIEVYSVDEAWLDLSGLTSDYLTYGRLIKEAVERNVGIPVGVGIAPTKVLAKLANHLAKKSKKARGVVDLSQKKFWDHALDRVEVEDIWGVGRASSKKLRALGIKTAKDLRDYKNENIILKNFTKIGLAIKHELMGIRCFDLGDDVEPKKEIMCSRSFGDRVYDKQQLLEALANHMSHAAEKLRSQDSLTNEIAVYFRTSPFSNTEQYYAFESKKLEVGTSDTRKLITYAWELADQVFRPGMAYAKAGVRLSSITHRYQNQLSFFTACDDRRSIRLMQLMDKVNSLEGPKTLSLMACGVKAEAWKMKRNYKSPRFTTCWQDIPRVK
jgi:DNA polymerase V